MEGIQPAAIPLLEQQQIKTRAGFTATHHHCKLCTSRQQERVAGDQGNVTISGAVGYVMVGGFRGAQAIDIAKIE